MEPLFGITLEQLAEIQAKYSELKTKYGERDGEARFQQQYLPSLGVNTHNYAQAHNAWYERMKADPTGNLRMRHHEVMEKLLLQSHFGDVPSQANQVRGGLTLDQYAWVSARSAAGEDHGSLLGQLGVNINVWHAGQAEWTQAMSADTSGALATEFGMLYQKHNPAQVQAMKQAAMQQIYAMENAPPGDDEPEPEPETFAELMTLLRGNNRSKRWYAAGRLANQHYRLEPAQQREVVAQAVPALLECLEQHDKHNVGDAEGAIRYLNDLKQFSPEVHSTLTRSYNRARERLTTLEAAFAPIQHKNVPERVHMQSEIQDYTSLVETFEDALRDWEENAASERESSQSAFAPSSSPAVRSNTGLSSPPSSGGSFIEKIVAALPFLRFLLRFI